MTGNLLAWAAQALILVAVSVLAPMLLRVRSPRAELWISQAVLAAMLLLPFVQPRVQLPAAPVPTVDTRMVGVGPAAPDAAPAGVPAVPLPDIETVLGAGVLLRLTWLAVGMIRLAGYRRDARPVEPDFEAEDLTGGRAEFVLSTEVPAPVTFGWRRPVVVVPPSYFEMPAEQRHAVACHELLHVRRRDWLACLAEELAAALMWFHPAVWFLMRRIRAAREHVVDAEVIRLTRSPEPYVEALLAAATAPRPMLDVAAAPLFVRRRDLTRRVQLLTEEYPPMSRIRAFVSTAAITVALVGAGVYATLTFPLLGAPQMTSGNIVRAEARALPEAIRPTVEAVLSGIRGQAFTTALMSQVNNDLQKIDPKLTRWWVEERPGEYSLSVAYTTPTDTAAPRVRAVDVSRLPQPQQSMLAARLNTFVNMPFNNSTMDSLRANAEAVDKRVAVRWRRDPGLQMVAVLLWDIPANAYQPVVGVLSRIDMASVPEDLRPAVEAKMARFRGAPMPYALMEEIRKELQPVLPNAGFSWAVKGDETTLTLWRGSAVIGGIVGGTPASPTQPTLRIGAEVLAAKRRSGNDPQYPALAQQARVQGVVKLQVQVGPGGEVRGITVLSGHPLLIPAAVAAVKEWKYEPTLLNGSPVTALGEVELPFRLP